MKKLLISLLCLLPCKLFSVDTQTIILGNMDPLISAIKQIPGIAKDGTLIQAGSNNAGVITATMTAFNTLAIGTGAPTGATLNVWQSPRFLGPVMEVDTGTTHIFEVNSTSIVASVEIVENGAILVFPDYVFDPDYKLLEFDDLRSYIEAERHLPDMKTAEEMRVTGMGVFEQTRKNLEKTEELYLYVLQLEDRIKKLEQKRGD